jgi:predicted transcriptional regulator YdeE
MELKPTFEEREPMQVFGYSWHGNDNKEIPLLWGDFGRRLGPFLPMSPGGASYGVATDMDQDGNFSYLVGIALGPGMEAGDGFEIWDVPGGRWAVFPVPLTQIHEAIGMIYGQWVPQSGTALRAGLLIERYPADFCPDGNNVLDILIPVF